MRDLIKILAVMLLLMLAVTLLTGCAAVLEELTRDPRDAPWDPRPGQGQLIDQIPNWDDAALRRCGGHLPEGEAERRGMSRRC
jgi:hypothetical protein